MKYNYKDNPLENKNDVQNLVIQMCEPLKPLYSEGKARLNIGNVLSTGTKPAIDMEKYARPLWGIVPLIAGGKEYDIVDIYLTGIRNGTNHKHKEFWGYIEDYDQRMVEMAEIALALILIPDKIWQPLNNREKTNLVNWLNQINCFKISNTNWKFFNIIVNIALKSINQEYNKEILQQSLEVIETFYIDNGWYSDGICDRIDYYIPMGFHYYSLIYAKVMEKDDPKRSKLFKDRAAMFAKDFIYWFSNDGSAIPFGRSLTYRFAEGAFWGALAFADVEALPWGVIKGIYLRHLRWWFNKPIFDNGGVLSIGYAYENLIMSESYNASGSPYWSMKAFLPLALSDEHPFWQAIEESLPVLSDIKLQSEPRMVIYRNKDQNHIMSFTAGQCWQPDWANSFAKYSKFVYSNIFGFNVSKGAYGLTLGAYDSTLAISECDNYYRVRGKCEEYKVSEHVIYSKWKPWNNVEVKSWIIPGNPWHIRIHKIETERVLDIADGGFAILRDENKRQPDYDKDTYLLENSILIKYPWGSSGMVSIYGNQKPEVVFCEPNTNLLYSQTYIPTLKSRLTAGTHLFISAVYGGVAQDTQAEWNNSPKVEYLNKIITIKSMSKEIKIDLNNFDVNLLI